MKQLRHSADGFVYFIGHEHRLYAPVKIGWSIDPLYRLRKLQTGNPDRLYILGLKPGVRECERDEHELYAHLRISREWFIQGPDLFNAIRLIFSRNVKLMPNVQHFRLRNVSSYSHIAQ